MDNAINILDPTLRDGSHAIGHSLSKEQVSNYVKRIDKSGVKYAEIGHGLGLGASSAQVGLSSCTDSELNEAALLVAKNVKICNFVIPGFATIEKNIRPAFEQGIRTFRFGTHCTEADLAKNHIEYVASQGGEAMASLIMSHMINENQLLEQAQKFQEYGASSVTLMDSAGAFSLSETRKKIATLRDGLSIAIGYHGHNNIGLSVANSIVAAEEGATLLDATARGFGAGAGNTPLEAMIAALHKEGFETGVELIRVLEASEYAENTFIKKLPTVSNAGVIGGFYGICGAFQKHILAASSKFEVPIEKICQILSERKAVAGQEDMIVEIAKSLSERKCA